MAAPRKYHYFVLNRLGASADRRGPFVTREAAEKWVEKFYHYEAWIVPAEPIGLAKSYKPLDENGNPVTEE